MKTGRPRAGEFTGRHMLAIMVAFFGVIISVNLFMAVMANRSWSGFVVQNTYIASREFNDKADEARRQEALGWKAGVELSGGRLLFSLADAEGGPVRLSGGAAEFRRPVGDREDATVTLAPAGDALQGEADIADGAWIVEIRAETGLGHPYRETRRVQVEKGAFR